MSATTVSTAKLAIVSGQSSSKDEKEQQFLNGISQNNAAALWSVLDKMVPPRPNPAASVTSWKYSLMRPWLLEAGSIVSAEEAERRVLMLVNSTQTAPYTTDTIYAGLQLVLPGETAPAHRHVASALRFIIEGSNGFTAIEGEKLIMERGDVILTPSWNWHDHGNEGSDPMIWLDGLDLPVYRFLPVNFAENYSEERYPSTLATNSNLKIPWSTAAENLDANISSSPYALFEYHRGDGTHLSKTISAQAERVASGTTSPISQQTYSFVYHIYQGEGYSIIKSPNGKDERVDWREKDTFSVPAWSVISHTCTLENGQAYLFAVTDRPMIQSLGLYRKS